MTGATIQFLEREGLPYLVCSTRSKRVLAVFAEVDDADLFKDTCLPPKSPWVLGKVVSGQVVHVETGEVLW